MPERAGVFDTRYFIEYFYSSDERTIERARQEFVKTKRRYISAITLHEFYKINLEREGRDVAELRHGLLVKEFKITAVDEKIARGSALLRLRYRVPMADSMIAATGEALNMPIITDNGHITQIREVKTRWIL